MSAKRLLAEAHSRVRELRTWIEIDARAVRKNYETFRRLIGRRVKLWAVVKSNAYGHGLFAFSKLADSFGVDGFCVDSLVEGIALRRHGIRRPILVLGPTLPSLYGDAARRHIAITISNFEALTALAHAVSGRARRARRVPLAQRVPEFHVKIDTGMHRQGFYLEDVPRVLWVLAAYPQIKPRLKGIYTHFAVAKDLERTASTEAQFKKLEQAIALFRRAGFKNLIKHASATGGALLGSQYHLDAVRVGIGLHGLWPSEELERQLGRRDRRGRRGGFAQRRGQRIMLHPTLAWRAVVSEVKRLKKGDAVGYDMTERAPRDMMMAVLPIGYWHGFPRALTGRGEVAVRGKRARVLGRVSMDLVAVGLPPDGGSAKGSGKVRPGDVATLIGRDGHETILAAEQARRAGTSHYELVTRLNPLMERVVVGARARKPRKERTRP